MSKLFWLTFFLYNSSVFTNSDESLSFNKKRILLWTHLFEKRKEKKKKNLLLMFEMLNTHFLILFLSLQQNLRTCIYFNYSLTRMLSCVWIDINVYFYWYECTSGNIRVMYTSIFCNMERKSRKEKNRPACLKNAWIHIPKH